MFPHIPQNSILYIIFGNTSLDQPAQSLTSVHTHNLKKPCRKKSKGARLRDLWWLMLQELDNIC